MRAGRGRDHGGHPDRVRLDDERVGDPGDADAAGPTAGAEVVAVDGGVYATGLAQCPEGVGTDGKVVLEAARSESAVEEGRPLRLRNAPADPTSKTRTAGRW